ncbi:MAG TPA: DUF493 domain-containing protein [Pirellulaceae bacterium]|nr:DUF493 domain-containing protein [Pirellulaceae bacterium]
MSEQDEFQRRIDLLNQTHSFPTQVTVKVIGWNQPTFVAAVVEVVRIEGVLDADPPYTIREARGNRHVAITLEPHLAAAEQVLAIYARLQTLEGVVFLM